MSTAKSRSPSVDRRHTDLVSPGGTPRGCLALSSSSPKSHSPSDERRRSSQRSSAGQASPPTGVQQPQSHHRRKIHHSRSQDLWLMQTPNSGPSKNTINAATVDLVRRVPHSDGKVREKYKLDPAVKGCCGIATTTPMNLNAPFLGDNTEEYKSLLCRGSRSGHNNKKTTSRANHDPRHRSSCPVLSCPVLGGNNNRMMSLFQHPPTDIGAKVEHPVSQ
jgi:hypothetical protein